MYAEKKAQTLSGTTTIENTIVVTMYASKEEAGNVNMSINIMSPTMYEAYKDACDEDIATFKKNAGIL